jgi:predicted nucleotidyltransferase
MAGEVMRRVRYRSRNRHREFLGAAKKIASKISAAEGVVGILATGGIGRGHCDYYSDLDLIVYADERNVQDLDRRIAVGGLRFKGIDFDTPVESYQRALRQKSPSRYWSQVMRWDRENSLILFDTDSRIKRLLKQKLIFPDWEQRKLLRQHARALTGHLIYGFELWEKRGNPVNLAHTLVQAAEHLILWIYARNKRFQPYLPKWLFYHLENDFVPESRYFSVIKQAYTMRIGTRKDACSIRDNLITLCEKVGLSFDFLTFAELFEQDEKNWEKASEETRHYLSW